MKNHIIVLLAMAAMAFRTGTSLAAGGDDLVTAVWGFATQKAAEFIDSGVDVIGKDAQGR